MPRPPKTLDPVAEARRKHAKLPVNGQSSTPPFREATKATKPPSNILGIAPGEAAADPLTLGEELAALRARYEAGEPPVESAKDKRDKKAYKPKAERDAEAQRFEAFQGSLGLVARVGSEMLCSALPKPEPPTELEVEVLDKALSGVAQKHFDKLLAYDAEASLVLVLLAILLPRLRKEKPQPLDVTTEARNIFEAAQEAKKLEAEKPQEAKPPEESKPNAA